MKRGIDIIVSPVSLCLLSPFLLLIALCVKMDSHGPVIYRQRRCGKNRRIFTIYKFRTMTENAENSNPCLATPDDPRVTRFGKILRRYHLDEIPQFWNVLTGDMSLVGPRPERPFFVEKILRRSPQYSMVFTIRPGLTSLGMVRFGYASDIDGMVERSKYDLQYLSEQSAITDFRILIDTAKTILKGQGI